MTLFPGSIFLNPKTGIEVLRHLGEHQGRDLYKSKYQRLIEGQLHETAQFWSKRNVVRLANTFRRFTQEISHAGENTTPVLEVFSIVMNQLANQVWELENRFLDEGIQQDPAKRQAALKELKVEVMTGAEMKDLETQLMFEITHPAVSQSLQARDVQEMYALLDFSTKTLSSSDYTKEVYRHERQQYQMAFLSKKFDQYEQFFQKELNPADFYEIQLPTNSEPSSEEEPPAPATITIHKKNPLAKLESYFRSWIQLAKAHHLSSAHIYKAWIDKLNHLKNQMLNDLKDIDELHAQCKIRDFKLSEELEQIRIELAIQIGELTEYLKGIHIEAQQELIEAQRLLSRKSQLLAAMKDLAKKVTLDDKGEFKELLETAIMVYNPKKNCYEQAQVKDVNDEQVKVTLEALSQTMKHILLQDIAPDQKAHLILTLQSLMKCIEKRYFKGWLKASKNPKVSDKAAKELKAFLKSHLDHALADSAKESTCIEIKDFNATVQHYLELAFKLKLIQEIGHKDFYQVYTRMLAKAEAAPARKAATKTALQQGLERVHRLSRVILETDRGGGEDYFKASRQAEVSSIQKQVLQKCGSFLKIVQQLLQKDAFQSYVELFESCQNKYEALEREITELDIQQEKHLLGFAERYQAIGDTSGTDFTEIVLGIKMAYKKKKNKLQEMISLQARVHRELLRSLHKEIKLKINRQFFFEHAAALEQLMQAWEILQTTNEGETALKPFLSSGRIEYHFLKGIIDEYRINYVKVVAIQKQATELVEEMKADSTKNLRELQNTLNEILFTGLNFYFSSCMGVTSFLDWQDEQLHQLMYESIIRRECLKKHKTKRVTNTQVDGFKKTLQITQVKKLHQEAEALAAEFQALLAQYRQVQLSAYQYYTELGLVLGQSNHYLDLPPLELADLGLLVKEAIPDSTAPDSTASPKKTMPWSISAEEQYALDFLIEHYDEIKKADFTEGKFEQFLQGYIDSQANALELIASGFNVFNLKMMIKKLLIYNKKNQLTHLNTEALCDIFTNPRGSWAKFTRDVIGFTNEQVVERTRALLEKANFYGVGPHQSDYVTKLQLKQFIQAGINQLLTRTQCIRELYIKWSLLARDIDKRFEGDQVKPMLDAVIKSTKRYNAISGAMQDLRL